MTDAPAERDYPLTVVADDAEGNEVYRTQLDWAGSSRNLDDVPSADLNNRVPTWATLRVLDAEGNVRQERSNDAARERLGKNPEDSAKTDDKPKAQPAKAEADDKTDAKNKPAK